jgi:RimJ/RimL family protein N-acetyltransferase
MIFQREGLVAAIRKPEISDIPRLAAWFGTDAYLENFGGIPGANEQQRNLMAENVIRENANDYSPSKYFLIEDRYSRKPAGLAMLSKIDWRNRHAEFSFILGEADSRGKLLGADFTVVLFDYFFNDLGLNKVYGFVRTDNLASTRLSAFGGRCDGTLRRHSYRSTIAPTDIQVFSVTRREYAGFVARHASTLLCKHLKRGLVREVR